MAGVLMSFGMVTVSSAPAWAAAPDAPTAVSAVPGDQSVAVSWTPPAGDVTSYLVTSDPGPFTCTPDPAVDPNSCTVTGLTNGVTYSFTVEATNGDGTSLPSDAATATPDVAPLAPSSVQATQGDTQVAVTWTAPADNGGTPVTNYTVTSTPDGLTCSPVASPPPVATSCTVNGLSNGTPYSFVVVATNPAGDGPPSSASADVTPVGQPGQPDILTATPSGSRSATVTFTAAPTDGGVPIYSYWAECIAPPLPAHPVVYNALHTFTVLSIKLSNLVPGVTYQCHVRASNGLFFGPYSPSLPVVVDAVPGLPTALHTTPANSQLTLTWTAPSLPLGVTPVTGYHLACTHLVGTTPTPVTVPDLSGSTATTAMVAGLTNGVTYTCKLSAGNGTGFGALATTSGVPRTAPDAPTVTWAARAGSALATWTPPANNGGSAITGYRLSCVSTQGGLALVASVNVGPTVRSATVKGLRYNVTYSCSAASKNVAAVGTFSDGVLVTPQPAPSAPLGLVVSPGSQSATLTFKAPPFAEIVSYTASCASSVPGAVGLVSVTATGTSITVGGLTSGAAYMCRVQATNSYGTGVPSAPRAVTPL